MSASHRSMGAREHRSEPHDSLDDFPTPSWAGRALCEYLLALGVPLGELVAWECAANRGFLWRALVEYFDRVHASDIHDYGVVRNCHVKDFLLHGSDADQGGDLTITNPPFRLAEQFILRALDVSRIGCAMLLRTNFIHSDGRYRRLFKDTPPTHMLHFSERVVMLKGRMVRAGETDWVATETAREKDAGAAEKKASTATEYTWFIWLKDRDPMPSAWVPPGSRLRLERQGDYEC